MTVHELTRTIGGAVSAAGGDDLADYERAVGRLVGQPAAGRLLGDIVRALLEEANPDGLDADDISAVLSATARDAYRWLPPDRVDIHVLLAVIASSLGIHEPGITYQALDLPQPEDGWRDPDDTVPVRPPGWTDYAWHAPLLVAQQLTGRRRPLNHYLEATLAEIAREETQEAP